MKEFKISMTVIALVLTVMALESIFLRRCAESHEPGMAKSARPMLLKKRKPLVGENTYWISTVMYGSETSGWRERKMKVWTDRNGNLKSEYITP